MIWISILFVMFMGMFLPIQSGVNTQLSRYLDHPFQAAFISFAGGALIMAVACVVLSIGLPTPQRMLQVPIPLWFGGLWGALMVTTSIVMAPRLGAALLISSYIAGQLSISLVFDHFGWMGFPHHPVNLARLAGLLLLFIGIFLMQRF